MSDDDDLRFLRVPILGFTEEQLNRALDAALAQDETKLIWQIVAEMERRGQTLVV